MNKKKKFFITSKRVILALSLKKQKINLLKSFVKNNIFFNFCICLFFMDVFIPTSSTAFFSSDEEEEIIPQTSQSSSQKKSLTNVSGTLDSWIIPSSPPSDPIVAKTSLTTSDDKRAKRNSPESGTKSPDIQKKQKTSNASKSSSQTQPITLFFSPSLKKSSLLDNGVTTKQNNTLASQRNTLSESEEDYSEVNSLSSDDDCSEQEADAENVSLLPRNSLETLTPVSSLSTLKQRSVESPLNKAHSTTSSSSSLNAIPTSVRTSRANLAVYLFKPAGEVPETLEGLAETFQSDHWHGFPWQLINASKYPLIGARETHQDSEDLKYFIDAQVYTNINDDAHETIYVFQETGLRQTEWIKILHGQTKKYRASERTLYALSELDRYKEPKGAVIFVKKIIEGQERFFALTFGTTGRFLLDLDRCDTSFGKHYAYNILVNNPNHRPHSFTEINLDEKKLQREQAKAYGKVVVERGVRAFIPKAMTVSDGKQSVCSFSGAHICVREEFDFGTIGEKCRQWLKTSQEEGYKGKYPHIDYFEPIEQQEEVNKAFLKSFERFYVEPPFEIEGGYGAQTIHGLELNTKTSWKRYTGLKKQYADFAELANDLQKFIKSSRSRDNTFKLLKDLKIIPKDDTGKVLSIWKGHQLISSMLEADGNTYWIEGGELFRVNKDFIELVNEKVNNSFVKRNLSSTSSLHRLGPFTNEDTQMRRNGSVSSEAAYSERMARENPEDFFLLDCQNIRVAEDTHSRSKVEPCDLLSREGDLIHAKKWTQSSSSISYLVAQSLNSAKLLIENPSYLEEFIKKIPENSNFADLRGKLRERDKLRIVIAFIHEKDGISPSGLPINAKMELYRGLLEIEKMGFKSAIISIKDNSTHKRSSSSQSSSSQSGTNSTQESFPSSLSSFSTLECRASSSTAGTSSPPMSLPTFQHEPDVLDEYDYSNLSIVQRPGIEAPPLRSHPLNTRGELQEAYKIDGQRFRRQNVAGTGMRCFFNSAGLEADMEIGKLKSKQNDPIVRYMIANEILSASANPEQLPSSVKEAIDYPTYHAKREALDAREDQRSTFIRDNPGQGLPAELQTTGQAKILLEELRKRALSLNSFHSFLDHHIGGEQMMVTFHDVVGEEGDNPNANYASVDAIAYINNLGIKAYSPDGDNRLHLTHQFIPEGATEVVYIYHEGVHFQALIPEEEITEEGHRS